MNPALKQAHLQTAQCQPADQILQKSLLFHPEKKNKKISPATQKLNLSRPLIADKQKIVFGTSKRTLKTSERTVDTDTKDRTTGR